MTMPKYICYKVVQETLTKFRLESVDSDRIAEVVRCGECQHYDSHMSECCLGGFNKVDRDADDFCSCGERKEDD